MEFILRLLMLFVSFLSTIVNAILNFVLPRSEPTYPAIKDPLLNKPVSELVPLMRDKKITSEQLVRAYINRIKEVNPSLNAVVEDRFDAALKDAQYADSILAKTPLDQIIPLYAKHPLLGIPFTVKEACGVKGLSHTVGNIHRKSIKSPDNGAVVDLLRSAGAIPLVVSANPEFCLSFETSSPTHGTCFNPYDQRRTPGGSSGGEAALNGSGATLFGVGSDIAGSIRLPALFCGVFGHKPTAGLLSIKGHFPASTTDEDFPKYLQLGPITRFARDLPILLKIMAGPNAEQLNFDSEVNLKELKIYYFSSHHGISALLHPPNSLDMKLAILKAVKCFDGIGLETHEVKLRNLQNTMEMCLAGILRFQGLPSVMTQSSAVKPSLKTLIFEFIRALIGHSLYSKEAVFIEILQYLNGFMPRENSQYWLAQINFLKKELLDLLGTNGVLFLPTFHTHAFHPNNSGLHIVGADATLLFNVLGLPATHVPMGLNSKGLPVGFQVVAAPYQDKLCLTIAAELEGAFGGWVPPVVEAQT